MKTIVFLFGFLALECWASEPVPRLTGEKLIQYFSSEKVLEGEFASGYLAGIADAAQGKAWCISWKQKPHEIDSDIVSELKKLSQERLHEKASALIIEIMKNKFPCK